MSALILPGNTLMLKKIHLCLNKTIFKVNPNVQILILMTILSMICNKIYNNIVPHNAYKKYDPSTEFTAISNLVYPRRHMTPDLFIFTKFNKCIIQNKTQIHENFQL